MPRFRSYSLAACFLLPFFCVTRIFAATWYLDKAATGTATGKSATDAWTSFAAVDMKSIQSGDTLLIQGGNYSTEELDLAPASSRTNITFKINPSATEQAVFKSISLWAANNCVVDGLLPGSANGHYSNSIQMFRTVGLNRLLVGSKTIAASSVLIRQTTGAIVRGIECDQSALKVGVDDSGMQQHGIAVNGNVYNLTVEYNYVHDTIGDGMNFIYSGQDPTSFTNIVTRYNYVFRVGDDCLQAAGNLDIYNNYFGQGGVPINYGGHPDVIQINPFSSYVKIHGNVLADSLQQPFLEKVEGEIYCYNNIILCLRSEAVPAVAPYQTGGAALSTADGATSQTGYQGPSFGNLIFANNIIYNDTAIPAIKGAWASNGTNNVVSTGNIYLNVRLGSSLTGDQSMFETTSLWWDLPGVVWYDSGGNVTPTYSPRLFGTALNKNPGLVDPIHLDFHPASGSSAVVNRSQNLTKYGITTDFDGNPRPATGNWTAGPFQWTGTQESGILAMIPNTLGSLPTATLLPSAPKVSIKVN